jgi:hypothetical protein
MKTLFLILVSLLAVHSTMAQVEDCACCTKDHTAFDFWVGTWEVTLPNGAVAQCTGYGYQSKFLQH